MKSKSISYDAIHAAWRICCAVTKSFAWTSASHRAQPDCSNVSGQAVVRTNEHALQKQRSRLRVIARFAANGFRPILLFFLWSPLAHSEWGYVDSLDEFTDDPIRYAYYTDDDHYIQLSRHGDNSAWMYVTRKKIGSFEPNSPVEFRVDQGTLHNAPIELSQLLEGIGRDPYYIWEPGTIAFRVWHGDPEAARADDRPNPCGFIADLLSGSVLRVRYYVSRVDRDTFSVDLSNSAEPIVNGLGVDSCVNRE